jgi:dipeptide/tripeptide permease
MSEENGKMGGIIGGVVAICIGALLIFLGISVLNISPESKAPEGSLTQMLENTPRNVGWAFLLGGIIGLIIGFILIIVSVKS